MIHAGLSSHKCNGMTSIPVTTRPGEGNHPRDDDVLLSADFMHKLDRLDVLSRKILAGKLQGERRSKRRGQSVEFADYRPYVAGDDLRFIDWNLYARLDRLFLRLFMEEEDLSVSILLDVSRSMDWGEPNKLHYARRLAAALSYISLVNYNRLHLYSFADTLVDQLPNQRGRRPIPRILDFLRSQQPREAGHLAAACKRFSLLQRNKGVVIVLSDLLDKGDLAEALRYLAGERYDVYFVQLLAPQEVDPAKGELVGDLRLLDSEDGQATEVSVSAALLKRYQANLQAYCLHVKQQCQRRGIAYMLSDTSIPFDTLVLQYLRQKGLLG